MSQQATATVLPMPPQQIAAYNEFRSQLAELEKHNSALIFDYEDPKGNKEARSHVYKLRQTKSALDKARQKEKAASLEFGRRVDAEAKEITTKLEAMIDHHQKYLDEIEGREKARIEAIQQRIANIARFQECRGHDSQETGNALVQLRAMKIDESFAEFQLDALNTLNAAIAAQEAEHAAAVKREEEAKELARLRAAEEERTRAAREQAIRDEEAVKAEQKAAQAVEAERQRAAREVEQQAAETARREADLAHKATIDGEIAKAMEERGLTTDQADTLILAIRSGKIPHLKITY